MPTRIFVAWALVSIAIVALLAVGMGIGYMIGRRQPAVRHTPLRELPWTDHDHRRRSPSYLAGRHSVVHRTTAPTKVLARVREQEVQTP